MIKVKISKKLASKLAYLVLEMYPNETNQNTYNELGDVVSMSNSVLIENVVD